jgi:hypothetical protein
MISGEGPKKLLRKSCPSANPSITNLTWTQLRSKPRHRGERPASLPVSYGTANFTKVTFVTIYKLTTLQKLCNSEVEYIYCLAFQSEV